ncbi:hypothetical protein M422DRAFT_780039 [Sphaerobolus stellatus SS14]|uniref:Fungal-type protein kinase domain-containing protein n=1 Tax=Sphaerobolus stellatus (strain SS14) TaxID=990650 RepID=A0A0C9UHE7_SPHS4|nr:hypothetical protein M422DRAFT_780039 [Sphaerobolus stellatus SS14]
MLISLILDHQKFYRVGVLHRDISQGNVIIAICDDGSTCGRLIDLDHAKVTVDGEPNVPLLQTTHCVPDPILSREMDGLVDREIFVNEDTIRRACAPFLSKLDASPDQKIVAKACDDGINYLKDVYEGFGLKSSKTRLLTPEDFHWVLEFQDKPNFENHQPGDGNRTGTAPYMSYQIIDPNGKVAHDAIHDIESFFWLLIHIMLTRNGPGGSRRDISVALERVLNQYFHADPSTLTIMKGGLFLFSEKYEDAQAELSNLMVHFDSYFESLKGLVQEWWNLLYFAHKYKAYELWNVHANTLRILDKPLPGSSSAQSEQTNQEVNRREEYHKSTLDAIKNSTIARRPQPRTPEKRDRKATSTASAQPVDPVSQIAGHGPSKKHRKEKATGH